MNNQELAQEFFKINEKIADLEADVGKDFWHRQRLILRLETKKMNLLDLYKSSDSKSTKVWRKK